MKRDDGKWADSANPGKRYPWWEPYVFTAGIAVVVVVMCFALGYLSRIPYLEYILYVLMTVAGLVEANRRSTSLPSLAFGILASVFLGILSFAYLLDGQSVLGFGYAVLVGVWLSLAINAAIVRHRMRKETLAKLNHAVETLRRAVKSND